MPNYIRSRQAGGIYFFTLVTFDRLPLFSSPVSRDLLHSAWVDVLSRHPFDTIAVCLLPDHLHTIWKLPEGDDDYPVRWKEIKRIFTRNYIQQINLGGIRNKSRQIQGEAAIWQRRYWEHTCIDNDDLNNHIDYIHINPLKHGLVRKVSDWDWSSFHQYVKKGIYPVDWGGKVEIPLMVRNQGE
jgi:putative transposase